MKLPHFLVVGAARAGTTSLYYYLRQHPGLYLPRIKEPCFFCFAGEDITYKKGKFAFAVRDFEKYQELFHPAKEDQRIGECSTPYLYLHTKTIRNIRHFHPHAEKLKIIILLRNPVDRAYSQYLWRVRDGRENLSFEEAIHEEPVRMKKGYSFDYFYVDRGYYHEQVKAYLDNFEQVKIILLDDLKEDTVGNLREICGFLGVNEFHEFRKSEDQNESFLPRWKLLSRMVTVESKTKFRILNQLPDHWRQGIRKQFQHWNSSRTVQSEMQESTRSMLRNIYRTDLLRLQNLIGRDLSAWLNP